MTSFSVRARPEGKGPARYAAAEESGRRHCEVYATEQGWSLLYLSRWWLRADLSVRVTKRRLCIDFLLALLTKAQQIKHFPSTAVQKKCQNPYSKLNLSLPVFYLLTFSSALTPRLVFLRTSPRWADSRERKIAGAQEDKDLCDPGARQERFPARQRRRKAGHQAGFVFNKNQSQDSSTRAKHDSSNSSNNSNGKMHNDGSVLQNRRWIWTTRVSTWQRVVQLQRLG